MDIDAGKMRRIADEPGNQGTRVLRRTKLKNIEGLNLDQYPRCFETGQDSIRRTPVCTASAHASKRVSQSSFAKYSLQGELCQ